MSLTRPIIPRNRGPYQTSLRQRIAISLAQSYTFNRSNIEAPWYGVQNSILTDLVKDAQSLLVVPQLDFDISSSMWTVGQPAMQALDQTVPASAAPPASTSNDPAPASPQASSIAAQQAPNEKAMVRIPIHDTIDVDDADELGWETEEEEVDDEEKDPSYDPEEDGSNSDTSDGDSEDHRLPHPDSAGRSSESVVSQRDTLTAQVTAEGLTMTSGKPSIADGLGPEVTHGPEKPRAAPKWDTSSAKGSDRNTISDKKALRRYPDFCIVHTISELMKKLENNTDMDEAKRERYERLCELWASRRTCHRCLLLIEEDKRGPSRRAGCNVDAETKRIRLSEAIQQLIKYASAYFYAVPNSPGVIVRPTAGMWWQKLYVTPADTPAFDPTLGSIASDPRNRLMREQLAQKFVDSPIYRLRTEESDRALTKMREDMLQLARECEAAHPPKAAT